MKKILYIILFVFIICFIAILSKPSDETILKKVNEQITDGVRRDGGDLVGDIAGILADVGTPSLLRIEEHLFYKQVYIKYTNKSVAKAYFGCVFIIF